MWTITQLKDAARNELKVSYWLSFAVCLVSGILAGGGASPSFSFNLPLSGNSAGVNIFDGSHSPSLGAGIAFAFLFLIFFIFALIISFGFNTFVTNPIIVGKCRYFIKCRDEDRSFKYLFSGFSKNNGYLSTVKTMLLKNIFISLWSLLFIIPGIIKSYSWRMVPYILSEYPNMHYKAALDLSEKMTNGEKANMFVLDLSFLGWIFLGVMACGVGVYFVTPYIEATWVQFYFVMRDKIGLGGVNESDNQTDLYNQGTNY
ncbi:MAG: DUF975 family protein [Oscillospiraceae bacterium]|nr:DUF975 family protein [Oscillospiraceae bacterium]